MSKIDLTLYLVLDANLCKTPEGMAETAVQACKGGATVVQLRAPEWKKRKILRAARLLKEALKPFSVPLIINDHVDVALLSDADGVHVGQDDIPPEEVRKLLGPGKILGLSVGSLDDLPGQNEGVDYLGVGPVFSTKTKADAGDAIGLDGLSQIVGAASLPAVAIGGINASNVKEVIRAGADGAAVVSAICGTPSPEKAASELLKEIKEARCS